MPDELLPHAGNQTEALDPGLDVARMMLRFQQILAAHEDRPEQAASENRYRNLAARLLQERAQLAEELNDAHLTDQEREQEFQRRSAAIDRFATIWNADDPLSARLKRDEPETPGDQSATPQNALMNALPWTPMLALPGYDGRDGLNAAIRTLGRRIFSAFPCFQKMSAAAQDADVDALGQVMALSTMLPDQAELVRTRIEALKTSCIPVAEDRLPGLSAMPGYRPGIAIALSEQASFLIVRERRANGAPLDADTIYAWDGGLRFYQDNPERIGELRRLLRLSARTLAPQAPAALRLT